MHTRPWTESEARQYVQLNSDEPWVFLDWVGWAYEITEVRADGVTLVLAYHPDKTPLDLSFQSLWFDYRPTVGEWPASDNLYGWVEK